MLKGPDTHRCPYPEDAQLAELARSFVAAAEVGKRFWGHRVTGRFLSSWAGARSRLP